MFTGLIEEVGVITDILSDKITIKCKQILEDCNLGDSIAVNGVCLTVTDLSTNEFSADISKETMRISTLSKLKKGEFVNLERALRLSSRLGGHIVTGHIDTVGEITKMNKLDEFYEICISFDKIFKNYVVTKGSVTINGISLTIKDCGEDYVTIAIIPHTYNNTVLKHTTNGDNVNIEFDILAKYVEKNLSSGNNNNITVDFLAQNGFI